MSHVKFTKEGEKEGKRGREGECGNGSEGKDSERRGVRVNKGVQARNSEEKRERREGEFGVGVSRKEKE